METETGNLLSQIPGQWVARAAEALPAAAGAQQDVMEVVLDVPGLGAVLFNFDRRRHKRGKAVHYFWCARWAKRHEAIRSGDQ